jgi:photosystem II stability/assembly factor-like uncharacterized protein
MVDSLTGWIGGSEGSILKTSDGGSSWLSQYSDSGQTQILQIRFVDKFTGFAIAILKGVGALLKTTNGGDIWTIDSSLYKIAVDSGFVLSNLSLTTSGDSTTISVLCWSYSGAPGIITAPMYFSRNNGRTWTQFRNYPVSESLIFAVASPAPATVLLLAGSSIFRTINNGDTWQQYQIDKSGNNSIYSIRFMNSDTGFFVTQSPSQLLLIGWTFNGGGTWTIDSTKSFGNLMPYSMYFVNSTFGFAVIGNNSSIFRTTDAGITWQEQKFSSYAPLYDICSASGKTVVGAGAGGRIMISNDSGITWQDLTPPTKVRFTFVKYLSDNLVAAIGNSNELFLSIDSCKTWTKHDMPSGLNVTIAFGDSLHCWIADDSSRIFYSGNLGATWEAQKELNSHDPPLYGIHFFNDSSGCSVGASGFITATNNGGRTWIARASNTSKNLYSIFVASRRRAWAVGQSGTIITTSDAFSSWSAQTSPTSTTLRSVIFSDTLNGYILGDGGTILKTSDGGTKWKELPSPGASSNAVEFINAGEGWVVADSGRIFRTVDGGNHWLSQESGVHSSLTSVDFTDSLHGVVVGEDGVVLATKNGGIVTIVERTAASTPTDPGLQQNYPNPFNPSTTINYSLPRSSRVILRIYDVLGREVRTLVDEKQNAGSHNIMFRAGNLPSGVYFYRLEAGTFSETKKLLLLK